MAITAISPRIVPPGTPATITITGTGFEANSVVLWNGANRPTTVVSATVVQVTLSAADLQNQGTGSLTVSNPAPAASTSPGLPLIVTSQPIPVIQNVTIASVPGLTGGCSQLQATITGQNFDYYYSTVQANGVQLQTTFFQSTPPEIIAFLPPGFVSNPGALSFTVADGNQVGCISLRVGDHVDVFSTTSNQFVAALHPAAQGAQKGFGGLALTPDGSQSLVTDLLDGSLAVNNSDAPSNTYAIRIAAVTQLNGCPGGPLYVAATSTNQAFVATGSLPALRVLPLESYILPICKHGPQRQQLESRLSNVDRLAYP